MSNSLKWILALGLLLAATVVGFPLMIFSELNIDVNTDGSAIGQIYSMSAQSIQQLPVVHTMVQQGLKPYFLGLGIILFAVALAYILIDGEDKTDTLKDS